MAFSALFNVTAEDAIHLSESDNFINIAENCLVHDGTVSWHNMAQSKNETGLKKKHACHQLLKIDHYWSI